ncbi:MAG: hypothetical protein HLUCCO02_02810 [Idiomarinaceae bacterium HL-53]|nr:MAG: hypothetical protein HLUCCO02_02810 [Idiomarinaceae bacterium HL-53]
MAYAAPPLQELAHGSKEPFPLSSEHLPWFRAFLYLLPMSTPF